jgi:hypothetical protein
MWLNQQLFRFSFHWLLLEVGCSVSLMFRMISFMEYFKRKFICGSLLGLLILLILNISVAWSRLFMVLNRLLVHGMRVLNFLSQYCCCSSVSTIPRPNIFLLWLTVCVSIFTLRGMLIGLLLSAFLRYVCHTTTYALHRPTSSGLLSAFTDVNWTGWSAIYGGYAVGPNPIASSAHKQATVCWTQMGTIFT